MSFAIKYNKMIKIEPCDQFVAYVLNCRVFFNCNNCFSDL